MNYEIFVYPVNFLGISDDAVPSRGGLQKAEKINTHFGK